MIPSFDELIKRSNCRPEGWEPPELMLCLDPGETTGWALFEGLCPIRAGQIACKENPCQAVMDTFEYIPALLVYEDYRVYSWKANDHSWKELFTPKLIGMIQLMAYQNGIPTVAQMANIAKQFVTDDKLKAWGAYNLGGRHARDALRHGFYWLLFGK